MLRLWLILPLLLLYLLHLGGVGFLGPDEPRYASIGREMARSGDWITPRLGGEPWFEKPPLSYWLTAAGHLAHLPEEWATRLPQALVSVAFLVLFHVKIAREFSPRLATGAAAILATSAGWMAYSFAALTDLPMAAALNAAVFVTLFGSGLNRGWIAGALLGFSILGKGFVPVVLFAPVVLLVKKDWWKLAAGAIVIASPWYVLCYLQNGAAFWDDFFWKQHVGRFFTPEREHVQPVWYYVPVLLAGLFPWTPLAALLTRGKIYDDVRIRLLAAWMVYGFVFFSASKNKLPGYLLPLLPALAIVLAVALEKAPGKQWWLAACAACLIVLPTAAAILPAALVSGLSRTSIEFAPLGLVFALVAGIVWWIARGENSESAVLAVAFAAGVGILYVKSFTFPELDYVVSVREFWRSNAAAASSACVHNVPRAWEYGLNYYAGHKLERCAGGENPAITVRDRRLLLEAAK